MLTPRLIYEAGSHLIHTVQWIYVTESPWMYCGVSGDLNQTLIEQHLHKHFQEETKLYFALDKKESFATMRDDALKSIVLLQGKEDFSIWDMRFQRVMQFNHIGVFREGESSVGLRSPPAQD